MQINEKLTKNISDKIGDLTELETADKTSTVAAINSMMPVTLYSSSEYTADITLNDDAANYKYFIVRLTGNTYSTSYITEESMVLVNPNGKTFGHSICWYNYSNNQLYGGQIRISISGTSLTANNTFGTVGASTAYFSSSSAIIIAEVIGFK